MKEAPHVLILAAGKGKRMKSRLPKVLHPVLFRSMIHHVLDLATSMPHSSVSVVVGHGSEQVREHCSGYSNVNFIEQKKQLGTADAVNSARDHLGGSHGDVLVLSGDVILLSRATLNDLLTVHSSKRAMATLLTGILPQPRGYGRILREERGEMVGIREEVDCSDSERKIQEVNAGVYLFKIQDLFRALDGIENENKQGEFYLTDVIEVFSKAGGGIGTVCLNDPMEMTGINDRYALSKVESHLQRQVNRDLMMGGVTLQRPSSVRVDPRSRIDQDVLIEPNVQIINSVIDSDVVIEQGCRIVNSAIAKGTTVKQGSYINESLVGANCQVGPYAHFRPGTRLENDVKIGNFVEVKKSLIREGAKASHLSYIGDADIGKGSNLGCGFITCNFDGGPKKHRTQIGDGVFVGSDSQVVAPVSLGKGSYVASGTTVTEDVPDGALVISRGRQIIKEGYGDKIRARQNNAKQKDK